MKDKTPFSAICHRCGVNWADGFIESKETDRTSMGKIAVCKECLQREEVPFLEEEF